MKIYLLMRLILNSIIDVKKEDTSYYSIVRGFYYII